MFFEEKHACAKCIRFFGIFWEETICFLQFSAFQSPLTVVILLGKPAKRASDRNSGVQKRIPAPFAPSLKGA